MQNQNWECPKCSNKEFETDLFTATGGALTKFFNIQNQKFTTITFNKCTYTEMYKGETSILGNILDFFGN